MTDKDKTNEMPVKKKGQLSPYVKVGLTIFVTVAACILFFFLVYRFNTISTELEKLTKAAEPIIFGLVLAYLLMPVKKFIEKHTYRFLEGKIKKEGRAKKWAKTIAITGSVIFLLVIIAVLLAIIIPAVISSVAGFIENIQGYAVSFFTWFSKSKVGSMLLGSDKTNEVTEITNSLTEWVKGEFWPKLQSYLSELQGYIVQITSGVVSVFKTLLNFIIGIFVMIYAMAIEDQLVGQAKKIIYAIFSVKKANVVIETVRKSNEIFGGFIIGKIIDSAIIGVICYIGCAILRMPSALLVAVIVGVTNIIPFFGPFMGALVAIPLVLIQSPIHGLYLAIFILILQQVDGNIIGPKILGDSTGLPSGFWVIFSITIFGGLFGFAGMVFGVPLCAVIYEFIRRFVRRRLKRKDFPTSTEPYINLKKVKDESEFVMFDKSDDKYLSARTALGIGNMESSENSQNDVK